MVGKGLNGTARPQRRGSFAVRLTGPLMGRIEAALAALVLIGVLAVAFLVFRIPGPLVVQLRDDKGGPVIDAKVSCTGPDGSPTFSGATDVFGEAKWPGLQKGPWRCRAEPPLRWHAGAQEGAAVVGDRAPAMVKLRFERPVHATVEVKRPKGVSRAAVAVRAVCPPAGGAGEASWEARAGVLGAPAVLWLPHGRSCRVGLVRPELGAHASGPVPQARLACDALPCAGPVEAGVGGQLELSLEPTPEQWEAARPAPEPEPEPAAARKAEGAR